MIARIAFDVLLFLLPFVLYGLWLAWARRRAATGGDPRTWRNAPFGLLVVAGLVLVLLSFIAWRFVEPDNAGGTYEPARVEDGRLVPGRIRP